MLHLEMQRMGREMCFDGQVRRARWLDHWRRLTGERRSLVRLDDVAPRSSKHVKRLPEIAHVSLRQIVGSVGRSGDFTREFLPRERVDGHRWTSIERAINKGIALPLVELYRMGDVYFVMDGHHRISVSRMTGAQIVDALVTTLESPVWLCVEDFHKEEWARLIVSHRQLSSEGMLREVMSSEVTDACDSV
jgi:hypothetical protein